MVQDVLNPMGFGCSNKFPIPDMPVLGILQGLTVIHTPLDTLLEAVAGDSAGEACLDIEISIMG